MVQILVVTFIFVWYDSTIVYNIIAQGFWQPVSFTKGFYLWTKIKNSIDEVMEGITLQDIVDDYNKIKEKNEALTLQRSE